jgi:hypothetical protein
VRGERRWGMAGTPRTLLFWFSMGTRSRRCCFSDDSGPPSPPSPSVAPVKAPLTRGFCFLGRFLCWAGATMLAAIGLHTYTDVQWNVTTRGSYRCVVRQPNGYPSPDIPAFRFLMLDLRIPIPRCLPQVLLREMSLSSRTPGVRAPGVLNFRADSVSPAA